LIKAVVVLCTLVAWLFEPPICQSETRNGGFSAPLWDMLLRAQCIAFGSMQQLTRYVLGIGMFLVYGGLGYLGMPKMAGLFVLLVSSVMLHRNLAAFLLVRSNWIVLVPMCANIVFGIGVQVATHRAGTHALQSFQQNKLEMRCRHTYLEWANTPGLRTLVCYTINIACIVWEALIVFNITHSFSLQ
jgi:hypothetical protein